MRTSRIKADLLLVTGLHAFQKLVACAVLALLARHFDQITMGQLFFAMALALLLTMPTELGTQRHLTRAVAADPASAGLHLGSVVSLRLPLLVVSYVLLNAVGWAVMPEIGGILMLVSLYTFLDSFYYSIGGTFVALQRVGYHVAMYALGQVLLATLIVSAVLAGGNISLVLAGYVAANGIMVAVALAVLRWRIGPFPLRFDLSAMRRLAGETLPFFFLAFLELLLSKSDAIMIWFLRTPVEVANYESAYKFLEVSRAVVRPASMIFLPVLVQIATRSAWPEFRKLAARLVSVTTALGVVTAAVVISTAGWILPWVWGDAYAQAIPVLRVLFLAAPAVFIAFITQLLVSALRLERSAIPAMLFAVVLNIALNAAAIPLWGAVGAAWTTLASEVLIAVLLLRLVQRGIRSRERTASQAPGFEAAAGGHAREQVILR
jgi:O-antigen/teichoic acid export membrane protein